jgi:hypothetical protein
MPSQCLILLGGELLDWTEYVAGAIWCSFWLTLSCAKMYC